MSAPLIDRHPQRPRTAKAWHIASRWQEFQGEMRAAVLRGILVLLFYSIHMVHYLTLESINASDRLFQRQVTLITVAWLFLSMSILIALRGGFMHPSLKYVVTGIDFGLVSVLAWLGHGPNSPLVTALFLVLVMASLRIRIGLIWFATLSSMTCYMLLVGSADASWFDAKHETPLLTQAITMCSLSSTGLVLGQIVRSTRTMADTFRERSSSMNESDRTDQTTVAQ